MIFNYVQVIAIILFFNTSFALGVLIGALLERNKRNE